MTRMWRTYAACFPSQNQESFLWAHIQAFRHFGGVPRRISYDNLATAVKLTSFEDLNPQILARCLREDTRTVAREPQPIGGAWEHEALHGSPG